MGVGGYLILCGQGTILFYPYEYFCVAIFFLQSLFIYMRYLILLWRFFYNPHTYMYETSHEICGYYFAIS